MDTQLQQLKRAVVQSPADVAAMQRYISALERALGGVQVAKEIPKRSGWTCPEFAEKDHQKWCWRKDEGGECLCEADAREWEQEHPRDGLLGSPDGVCVYYSDVGIGEHAGRRTVNLIIDGSRVNYPLPESYIDTSESYDWCIFCGNPDERK